MDEIKVFLVAMLPISELRGAIPLALMLGVSLERALVISILGNFLPVPFLLIFLKKVEEKVILRHDILKNIYEKIIERIRKKTQQKIKKYGIYALILFTAIPLPFTGAYTACLASYLFGLDTTKSSFAIFFGIIIAAFIVFSTASGILSFL